MERKPFSKEKNSFSKSTFERKPHRQQKNLILKKAIKKTHFEKKNIQK